MDNNNKELELNLCLEGYTSPMMHNINFENEIQDTASSVKITQPQNTQPQNTQPQNTQPQNTQPQNTN
ncbi:hypothetical protein A0Z28_04290 [Campylobacter lari]|nr:hypothetical protein [Campylobacter lari]